MLGQLILVMTLVAMVLGGSCRPPCQPPPEIPSCNRFQHSGKCVQDVESAGTAPASCSCQWQHYLAKAEPWLINTSAGQYCYTWAKVTCAMERQESEKIAAEMSRDLAAGVGELERALWFTDKAAVMETQDPDVAKQRKRNGVEFKAEVIQISDGAVSAGSQDDTEKQGVASPDVEYMGKATRKDGVAWVQYQPVPSNDSSNTTVHHHWMWFLWTMQDEEFKMWVFVAILLLNILVVLLAVCCRSVQKSQPKEERPRGDLDPNMFFQNKVSKDTHNGGVIGRLGAWFRPGTRHQYSQMEDSRFQTRQSYSGLAQPVNGNYYPSRRPSGGLYEELLDKYSPVADSDLNNTYEVPVYVPKDRHRYSQASLSGSVSGRLGEGQLGDRPRSVSFSLLPPGASQNQQAESRRAQRPEAPPILPLGKYLKR